MTFYTVRAVVLCVIPLSFVSTPVVVDSSAQPKQSTDDVQKFDQGQDEKGVVQVHYLEIVTPDVDATCEALEDLQGVVFGDPIPDLGHARTATLDNGGRIGVRGPMRETEEPVVRPYLLVEDIVAAVDAAEAAGGEIAMLPTEIPGQGTFAIYILGGLEHGLWEV